MRRSRRRHVGCAIEIGHPKPGKVAENSRARGSTADALPLRGDKRLATRGGRRPIAEMKELPHTRSCFVCGESNSAGLNLRFETDGRIVQAHFVPRLEHVGFKATVHGGLIATVLDEIMVWACAV